MQSLSSAGLGIIQLVTEDRVFNINGQVLNGSPFLAELLVY